MSRILLGVSGGIAAYKALELVRLATAAGHAVRVVQTPASRRFVGEASFTALTGAPVLVSEFERDPAHGAFPDQESPTYQPIGHLALVEAADLYLIAPASANTIAKLAHGHADNLLTSAALAATCPVVVAPAMNNRMYEHPAVRANLDALRARGVHVIAPDSGRLASKGEEGVGRLPEPARLLEACERLIAEVPDRVQPAGGAGAGSPAAQQAWRGLRVLVTAGGTREPIDSVRFLGNSSSGRMGLALAQTACARGAEVTVVGANVSLPHPPGVTWCEVSTAAQLQQACEREFPRCDVLLMAAAVADFRPAAARNGKIKKAERERLTLELEPTADVLSALAARRTARQTLVGFAAEHGARALDHGRVKLRAKRLDAVVVNDISRPDIGFEVAHNEVTILTAAGEQRVPRASKEQVAEAILDAVERLRTQA
ncbi:MAG TPA: bifunctional phosphopantothenoylcysteine decarboxylase/phosphopantothenate--cysteine ligase CoaBC [Solirubrobacteraceae bacterium]|jgi:phosphopantothenoylcysteine decarboxylase/phosphopantothenate--cysteine ligase|nr:bifunctional phosphopantothenoylcysteine decarboxylase/phosphopantothenate--cysteine ligase CoaBC [Solirubrobacteraceae bacterium]